MPTLSFLLKQAITSTKQRYSLFLQLSLLAGLLASIIYMPATRAMQQLTDLANQLSEDNLSALGAALPEHLPMLIMGHAGLLLIFGLLLPFWARAMAPASLVPWDGLVSSALKRGLASFFHLVAAALMTLATLLVIALVIVLLGGVGGQFLLFAGVVAVIWLSILFSASANAAIVSAAHDENLRLTSAIQLMKPYMRPAVGSLAMVWFATLLLNATLEPVLRAVADGPFGLRLVTFMHGFLGFATAALHISVLYHIPGFRRQTP